MKVLERYSTFFVVLLFIIGATVYKEYLQAKRSQNTIHMSKTIGRYEHPFNSSIKGQKEFRVAENTLELFKRLSYELEAGATVNAISEASYMKHLQPVTAISSNHFIELMARIDVMEKFLPENIKIIVYDLGLKRHEVEQLRNIPNVAYRVFDFSVFPTFVLNLHNYSWKPLIIQRVLSEFGGVLWMDTSVVFQDSYDKIVQYMVEKNSSFLYYFKRAGHTILSGTDPRMLEFLPMKGTSEMSKYMPQAGAILIYNTRLVRDNIMKWVLACSLIEHCIAPSGPARHCDNFPPDKFGGCHLYDQSLFAITVSNAYESHEEKYTLPEEMSGFAYPWRVRNDNILLSKEFVIVYIVWAVIVILIRSIIWKLKCFV